MSGISLTLPEQLDGASMAQLLGLLGGLPDVHLSPMNTNGENAPMMTVPEDNVDCDNLDWENMDSEKSAEELFEENETPDSGSCPFMQYTSSRRSVDMSWKTFVVSVLFAGIIMFLVVSDEASKIQEEQ